jgi:mannose-1-phosphate guanylyltransferase
LYFKEAFDYLFVFNADIVCDYNLKQLLDFQILKGGEGTICNTKVKEPSRYGVIVYEENGKIKNFIEKPEEFISDKINAGLYVFKYEFLNRIQTRPHSIEREIFPKMASDGVIFTMQLEGFWMDIGQPKDFLEGNFMVLNNLVTEDNEYLLTEKKNSSKAKIFGRVLTDENTIIEDGAEIGPNVILGKNVIVRAGAKLKNTVVLQNSIIDSHSFIDRSIIGWNSRVGKWCRIKGLSILGEDVSVANEVEIDSSLILPNVAIKKDIEKNSIIMC